jgi:hypothetical protein
VNTDNNVLAQIKSIYIELQGYLLSSPEPRNNLPDGGYITDADMWEKFNSSLNRLNKVTDQKYFNHKLDYKVTGSSKFVNIDFYRSNLSGLIFRLHADYFPYDPPLVTRSESGQFVLNQNIHQEQSVSINIFKEQIEEKISMYKEGSNERNFLEKLKGYVATTNNFADILRNIIGLAKKIWILIRRYYKNFLIMLYNITVCGRKYLTSKSTH